MIIDDPKALRLTYLGTWDGSVFYYRINQFVTSKTCKR